jgi:hypothetical protein
MDLEHYLLGLRIMVEMAREERPDAMKLFLLGHSMGG